MEPFLKKYQATGESVDLVSKYRKLISSTAALCKGKHLKVDSQYKWFYGLWYPGEYGDMKAIHDQRDEIIHSMRYVSYKDCYNQTVLTFLKLAKNFKEKKRLPYGNEYSYNLPFSKYIRPTLGHQMKQWVDRCSREAHEIECFGAIIEPVILADDGGIMMPASFEVPEVQPFTMSVAWILNGSPSPMFKDLSSYDRYLLYLYFVEGNTIREMAEIVCKSKNTVNKDLKRILTSCRQNSYLESRFPVL